VLAGIALREQVRPIGWIGLAVSLGGAALISLGEGARIGLSAGVLLLFGCAVTWAVSMVVTKVPLRRYSALQVATYSVWAGTAALLVFAPGVASAYASAPVAAQVTVAYLGIGPIGLAYCTWSHVLSRLPATRTASYTYVLPAIAATIAWVWLGEAPGVHTVVGGLVALSGVAVVNGIAMRPSPPLLEAPARESWSFRGQVNGWAEPPALSL
jgi:drug/metabolite transporter (DMT)-like permease